MPSRCTNAAIQLIKFHLQSLLAAEVTWSCSIWCVKNSLLYLFIRVFGIRLFWFRAYVVMFIVALFGTGSILFYFLQCAPLRSMWDPSIPGVCGNQHAGLLATGIGNITTDLLILSLPVPRVWNMQVSLGSKAALTGIFGIGLLYVQPHAWELLYSTCATLSLIPFSLHQQSLYIQRSSNHLNLYPLIFRHHLHPRRPRHLEYPSYDSRSHLWMCSSAAAHLH